MGNVATTPEDWRRDEEAAHPPPPPPSSSGVSGLSPLSSMTAPSSVEDLDDDDLEQTPSIKELQEHIDSMRSRQRIKFARGVLVFSNVLSLVFAVLLIYYGASNRTAIDLSSPQEAFAAVGEEILELGEVTLADATEYIQHGYIRNVLKPYQLVIALGVALLVLSLCGSFGSMCPSRRVGKEILFGYFSTVLVFVCVLIWGAVMCFQYQNETQRFLEREVDSHWRSIRPLVPGTKKDVLAQIEDNSNLIISGAFCLVASVTMTLGLWASSRTMGHYFTLRKVMVSCSVSAIFSGLVLVSLSVYYGAKNIGGQWAPGVTAVSGVAIILLSSLGIYGVRAQSLLAMGLHLFLMCILSLFVSVVGVFVIAYPHVVSDLVHKHWRKIAHDYTGVNEKHFRNEVADNLFLLGSASILFGVLMVVSAAASFATCLEIYHKKKTIILKKIEVHSSKL
ncbi:hypothetical protein HOP50_07g47390 [Chloropicon primus]|uniref:Transmembrane protein n=2 Tax=Chloropicon primus TaxID=1764295 RepID=A0A5B8MS12_9CHLO|nr:hypothetical protein A3770_07p47180 [Chloropicon primus]UPR01417.1 hypothetical protein HOP50_07g47390 [Chloropicon primus]|eukprot:QDZ22200.1 hypothetical protein A3770_07p47180 [Chloropicon primus]